MMLLKSSWLYLFCGHTV